MKKRSKGLCLVIVIFGLCFGFIGKAETVIWQKENNFEVKRKNPGIYKTPCIATEGMIDGLTVNWEFIGEVNVEISADGGKHYYPVINGVPKREGFVPGRFLCCRADIKTNSYLEKISISYTDNSGVMSTFGNQLLRGFLYVKDIAISGNNEMLFNYPVKIELEQICGPVRFTAADKQTVLKHYAQQTDNDGVSTFWVKVPQIPKKGASINVYYGNSQAVDLSSGESVFEFFDDFNSNELDENKWSYLPDLNGSLRTESGVLILNDSNVVSKSPLFRDRLRLEFKACLDNSVSDVQASIGEVSFYSSAFPEAEHVIAEYGEVKINENYPTKIGVDYLYSVGINGSNILFSRANIYDKEGLLEEDCVVEVETSIITTDEFLKLRSASPYGLTEKQRGASFDWVRVRKSVDPEPKVVAISRQKLANLIQAMPEGYISQNVSVPFPIRIITVYDFPKQAELIISADGRRNYLRGVEPEKYYYASKDDFVSGENLRWKINTSELTTKEKDFKKITVSYFPGLITLISPNDGEYFSAGDCIGINWSAQEYESDYPLRLEYSVDGGQNYQLIAEKVLNTGSFRWQIDDRVKGKTLVKISDYYNSKVFDILDQAINIGDKR